MKDQLFSPTFKPALPSGLLYLTLLLGALACQSMAFADSAIRHYNIPAGPMATTVNQLAETGGIQAIYDTQVTQGRVSKGLQGSYSTEAALQKLLAGTGLVYSLSDGTATIRAGAKPLPKPLLPVANPNPSNPEPMSESTLPKVTVEADADNPYDDTTWQTDPYNTDYVLPKATAGTKTNTPVMETPLNVQVISKQVLKDQQVISLDKALRNVSGVTTHTGNAGRPSSGNAQQLFLRGFQTDALFRNGFRMDGNGFGFNQQFANVESVEVLKGPAAILYGRVEPGGMVNITTKQPLATPYYSLNQQFGSYDLYRTSIDASGPLTKDDTLLYRVNASFQSNNSFRDLVSGEDVFFAPTLKWNINPRTQATLEMEYNRSLSSLDQQGLPFVNNKIIDLLQSRNLNERSPMETENIFVGFNWSYQFNNDWSIKHQVSFKRRDNTQGSAIVVDSTAGLLPNNRLPRFSFSGRNTEDTVATILDLTGHFKTWGLEHTLLLGGDYYRFDSLSDQLFPLASNGSLDIDSISFEHPIHTGSNPGLVPTVRDSPGSGVDNYGLYLQDQIKLPYNVYVTGGLRYQYVHSTFTRALGIGDPFTHDESFPPQTDDAVTPRVGLLWNPKKCLSLYGNYTESFGANSGSFGFVDNGTPTGGSKPLPPEIAQQWEVGAKTELFDGRLRATLAYYDLTKQNVTTTDTKHRNGCGGNGCSIAVGEVRSRGPELDIQGEILPGWNVIATYTNQDVRVTKSFETEGAAVVGNRLQFTPRNIGSFWSTYEIQQGDLKGFKIGGGVTVQDSVVNDTNTIISTGYALVNLLAGYSFEVDKAKITAQLNVDNLLDKNYFTNVSPGGGSFAFANFSTPRTFMGSINVEY
jgi:iron complex outermembrane recepter protein